VGQDYEVRYEAGQLRRLSQGGISILRRQIWLSLTLSILAALKQNTSYTQTIKPVGVKIEPDIAANFFFYGTSAHFSSASGIAVNLALVSRIPSRFSFLAPVERGLYVQVVDFEGYGF